ncbi:MAG: hypothetical protein ACP5I4_15130 [Oceanipulchritudo sp.]
MAIRLQAFILQGDDKALCVFYLICRLEEGAQLALPRLLIFERLGHLDKHGIAISTSGNPLP